MNYTLICYKPDSGDCQYGINSSEHNIYFSDSIGEISVNWAEHLKDDHFDNIDEEDTEMTLLVEGVKAAEVVYSEIERHATNAAKVLIQHRLDESAKEEQQLIASREKREREKDLAEFKRLKEKLQK